MSVKKKSRKKKVSHKKSGKVHKCPVGEPCHQCEHEHGLDEAEMMAVAEKPDFDERDSKLSPRRKPAGPGKKRRRSVPSSTGKQSKTAPQKPVAPTKVHIKSRKSKKDS